MLPADLTIIDTNIDLGQWPTRRSPCDELAKLVARLHAHHVIEAWAGSYDGLFHADLTAVNNRLAKQCESVTELSLRPFGEINPAATGWETELRRCAEAHRMPGIRLHPNYHGYTLENPNFARLLKVAAELTLVVQLAVIMEDERMMHPLLRVSAVDVALLAKLVAETPGLILVLLNSLNTLRGEPFDRLLAAGDVYVEISMLERVAAIELYLNDVPTERILFGSHAPAFYFESARLKLQESALPAGHLQAIAHANARRLVPARS